jgi:hypothetical protein
MREKYFQAILQNWFRAELDSLPEIKPTAEFYELLQQKTKQQVTFLQKSRWFIGAAAMIMVIIISLTNFQQIFYPRQVVIPKLNTRKEVAKAKKPEIMLERSFKMHKDIGSPLETADKILLQLHKEELNYAIDMDVTQSQDSYPVLSSNDNYRLMLNLKEPAYLYIFQINSENQPIKLFPDPERGLRNPLKAEQVHYCPSEDEWYYLDENPGLETIYVCLSAEEMSAVDKMFGNFYQKSSGSKRKEILQQLITELETANSYRFIIENK